MPETATPPPSAPGCDACLGYDPDDLELTEDGCCVECGRLVDPLAPFEAQASRIEDHLEAYAAALKVGPTPATYFLAQGMRAACDQLLDLERGRG